MPISIMDALRSSALSWNMQTKRQDGPHHNPRHGTKQQDDRLFVARDTRRAARNGSPEKGNEEHLHVLVVEQPHAQVMPQLVEEEHAHEQCQVEGVELKNPADANSTSDTTRITRLWIHVRSGGFWARAAITASVCGSTTGTAVA